MNSPTNLPALLPVEHSLIFKESPYAHHQPELILYEGTPAVRVRCLKCGTPVVLILRDPDREKAEESLRKVAATPMECPGFHVELGGWDIYWRFAEALDLRYPPGKRLEIDAPTTEKAA